MSAYPLTAAEWQTSLNHRLGPLLDSRIAAKSRLFDHLVSTAKYRNRDGDTQRFGGLKVDHELDLRRLLDRQISGPVAFEDSASVSSKQSIVFYFTAAIAHQSTGSNETAKFVNRRNCMAKSQLGNLFAVSGEKVVWSDHERAD